MASNLYQKVGRVSLWENKGAPGAPVLTGEIELDGRKLRVSLWPEDKGSPGGPALTGSVEVTAGPSAAARPYKAAQPAAKPASRKW